MTDEYADGGVVKSVLYVEDLDSSGIDALAVARILELSDRKAFTTGDLFSDELWRQKKGLTVLFTHVTDKPALRIEDYATIIQNGGRVSSLILDGPIVYIGPIKSSSTAGACPECFRIRIMQRTGRDDPGETSLHQNKTSKAPGPDSDVYWVVSTVLRGLLDGEIGSQIGGSGLALHADPLRCEVIHVVKSNSCRLCLALQDIDGSKIQEDTFPSLL